MQDVGVLYDWMDFITPDEAWWGIETSRPQHRHRVHEAVYVVDGVYLGWAEGAGGGDLRVEAGNLIYYHPRRLHVPRNVERSGISWYVLRWRESGRRRYGKRPLIIPDRNGRLLTVFRWLWDVIAPEQRPHDLANMLVGTIVHGALDPPPHDASDWVQRVNRFLGERIGMKVRLADLEPIAGMNKFLLIRRYRAATGITPMQYLKRLRLDAAENLLRTTHLPLKAIADQVGFSRASYLSDVLRRERGVSARELRRTRGREGGE